MWNDIARYYQGWNQDAALGDFAGSFGGNWDALRRSRGDYTADETRQMVDDEYGGVFGAINDLYSQVNAGKNDFLNQYIKPLEGQLPLFQQARDEALASNQQQLGMVQQQEQNALASARQLANELRQAGVQRFGGGSSAGDFANAIQGREFQRSMNQIQQTSGQNVQKLLDQANSIRGNFQAQVQDLEARKAGLLAQAQAAFNDRLSQIDQMRVGAQENKAQLKLQALRELRSSTQQVQNMFLQQQFALQQQAASADYQLRNALAGYQGQTSQPMSLNTLPGASFSTVAGPAQATAPTPMGSVTKRRLTEYGA